MRTSRDEVPASTHPLALELRAGGEGGREKKAPGGFPETGERGKKEAQLTAAGQQPKEACCRVRAAKLSDSQREVRKSIAREHPFRSVKIKHATSLLQRCEPNITKLLIIQIINTKLLKKRQTSLY